MNYLATKDEKSDLLKTFQALDLNGDGQLTREELIAGICKQKLSKLLYLWLLGYKKIMNPETAETDVDNIMKAIDYNNSGAIDYSGKNEMI